jgi:hypothetical protein
MFSDTDWERMVVLNRGTVNFRRLRYSRKWESMLR